MYLELTNACNMRCEHCFMNAVRHDGRAARYMSRAVIEAACDFARVFDDDITLGGGEPTLHPDFIFAFGMALLSAGEIGTLCVTNGTNEDLTLRMLDLSRDSTRFSCEVSMDSFHDISLISPRVRTQATLRNAIRNNDNGLIAKGRGRNLTDVIRCPCQTLHVSWDGRVHRCGCRRKADYLGNILTDRASIEEAFMNKRTECDGRRAVEI